MVRVLLSEARSPSDSVLSEMRALVAAADGHTPVILGENGDQPLLGVVTPENLGLVLNPFFRKLQPMRLLLA